MRLLIDGMFFFLEAISPCYLSFLFLFLLSFISLLAELIVEKLH